ncbi:hypothetical protein [Enterococcus faecalis]|jgi:hypothetical protein|uniref:hypothetical protein n=1 Tax=Enterococcus faecalis TaxID=1351 RepID=UPI00177DEDF2|nr:hypothetical protein [Enterococcus faecalis]MBD9891113.1 hypothetical protein [Enterococcus faecalis]
MYVAVGEVSRETYVIGETQAEVFRKLLEEYPYVSFDEGVYPERLSIVQKEPQSFAND